MRLMLRPDRPALPPWLLCCMLIVILLGGCAPVLKTDGRMSAPSIEGERLLTEWAAQAGRYQSLQGLAKVKVKTPQRSTGGTQVIIARRPAQLRTETLSPFGTTLLLLATDGANLGVLVPSQNRYYFGRADANNIGRFTRIPISADDLVNALLYNSPVLAFDDMKTWQLPDGSWLLELSSWGRRQELVFDPQRRLVEMRYFDGRQLILKLAYTEFPADGPVFPQRIEMDMLEYDVEASMEFSELELNRTLQPGLFRLDPPPSVEPYDLDQAPYSTDKDGER